MNTKFISRDLVADIVDLFDDFLDSKEITVTTKFSNLEERKEVYQAALIFGDDHDNLMNDITNLLERAGFTIPHVYGIETSQEWAQYKAKMERFHGEVEK